LEKVEAAAEAAAGAAGGFTRVHLIRDCMRMPYDDDDEDKFKWKKKLFQVSPKCTFLDY
jgi:hypothetical protein